MNSSMQPTMTQIFVPPGGEGGGGEGEMTQIFVSLGVGRSDADICTPIGGGGKEK